MFLRKKLNSLKLNPKNSKDFVTMIIMLVALGICIELFAAYILDFVLSMMPDVESAYTEDISVLLKEDFVTLLSVFLIAPVVEEIVFRFLILRLSMRYFPFWIVNIIQAVLFGMYHGNWVQGVYAFLLGMLLGFILVKSGIIISSIIVHMSINISGVLMQHIPLFNEGRTVAVTVIAIISAIIGGILLLILTRDNKGDYHEQNL